MLQTLHHHRLNDYRPVALTSVAMKSFERLVLAYLKASTGPLLDPLQFAYRANRSVDDAVNMGLHCILQHLDRPGTYVRILLKTVEMIVDFRRNPPAHAQHCDCSGVIQIPGHHNFSGPEVGQSHWVYCEKGPAERLYFLRQLRKFNLPQELLIQFYSAIIESVLCTSITVWFSLATKSDLRRLRRVVRTAEQIIGTTSPLSKNCTYPEWAKGLAKSLWTPHIQHTPSLNCYSLVDATELWAPEWPDTETVSSLRQSISWTLDIKRGTHKHYLHLFIHHILIFFISILHISDLCTYNCLLYIVFLLVCTLPICILFFIMCPVLLLSFCCTVELLSL